MFGYLFISVVILLIAHFYLTRKKRPANFPPGPTPLPLIGNLLSVGLKPHIGFMAIGKKYGGIFSFHFGTLETVVVTDVKILREILVKPALAGRPKFQGFLDRCGPGSKFCRGIITSELSHWNEQRRFVLKNLRDFRYAKSSVQEILQEEIMEFMDNTLRKDLGKRMKSTHLFNPPILNSVWRIFTGMRTYQTDPKLKEVAKVVVSSLDQFLYAAISFAFPLLSKTFPNITGYNSLLSFCQPLSEFVKTAFLEHKATYVPGQARDIMDSMCEEIASTTDPNSSFYGEQGELNAMKSVEDLFVGSADTTSTSTTWIFLFMSLYPEIQEKVFEEIKAVIGMSRLPDLANRQQMVVTESVIMESLRCAGIFPLGIFHSTTEEVTVGQYVLPKDTVVITDLYAALHDKDIWVDPEQFRPSRFFLPDGTLNRSHEAFIPFSYGKRVCIAEKLARETLFLFTTSILQKFRVSLHGRKPALRGHINLVLSPGTHHLIFHERDA